jgi:hypothetical protein
MCLNNKALTATSTHQLVLHNILEFQELVLVSKGIVMINDVLWLQALEVIYLCNFK